MRRLLLALAMVLVMAPAACSNLAWRSSIDPVAPPPPESFDQELVARGADLAALGNCADCHTAPDGPAYAGGYPMHTPYGVIYGTNITPDPETGIGRWSEAAFIRAMRQGVDREGHHLYPAFPYDQFALATDDDLRAIYAFLMTRGPVRYQAPAPDLPFPLGFRPLLAGWKLLFLDDERFQPQPDQSDEWNRGVYLANGLGHCGACHTPRNTLGARDEDRYLAGTQSEGWYAPPLNDASPAPSSWTEQELFHYLRHGISVRHAVAAGPMGSVVRNLAQVPEADVRALSAYIASVMGTDGRGGQAQETQADRPQAPQRADGGGENLGAILFAGACAICHADAGPQYFSARVPLDQATSLALPDPRNLIHIILEGIDQPMAPQEPLMPGFANALTDEQVAAVASYLRTRFTDQPAWDGLQDQISRIRRERQASRNAADLG
jgi:mono/diheme cytochrome c family protein